MSPESGYLLLQRQEHPNAPMNAHPPVFADDIDPTKSMRKGERIRITWLGRTQTLREWCQERHWNYRTQRKRLTKGWPLWKVFQQEPYERDGETGRLLQKYNLPLAARA